MKLFSKSFVTSTLLAALFMGWHSLWLSASDNVLTGDEKKSGWKLLFNGKNTEGWVNREKETLANWSAENGELILKTPRGGDVVYISEQFENFELSLDWKAEGNSGVFLRMSSQKDWLNTGMEIQVDSKKGTGKHSTGALYDLVAPPPEAQVHEKGWNNFYVVCKGPIISCNMNGIETFRINLNDEKWKSPQGKFKLPYATLPRKGWIMLQDHGYAVACKNIKIRPLL